MAHGAAGQPSRPLGLSASPIPAASPPPSQPSPSPLASSLLRAESNGQLCKATLPPAEPPWKTPAVTPTGSSTAGLPLLPPPPAPPAPPPPRLPGKSALRSSAGAGGSRMLRKRVTIRETLIDDSVLTTAAGVNGASGGGGYSACRLFELRRLSLTDPEPGHRMAPPGCGTSGVLDEASAGAARAANSVAASPTRSRLSANEAAASTASAGAVEEATSPGVVLVVLPADSAAAAAVADLTVGQGVPSAQSVANGPLVVNGGVDTPQAPIQPLSDPEQQQPQQTAIRTFASASTSPSPSSPAVSATSLSIGSLVGDGASSSSADEAATVAASTAAAAAATAVAQQQQQQQQQQPPSSPHAKVTRQSSTSSQPSQPAQQQQQQHQSSARSREEKQKERQRRRDAQMWRRHQMELQLKQRGIAVSPCGRWIKHNLKCGEGAYKRVYRGYDREQGRPIAWCELKYQVGKDKPAEREQVRKEVEMMIKCEHPNIVRYYDLLDCYYELDENGEKGEKVKATVIVTEFMSEGTLKEKMKTFYNEQTREAVVEFSVFQSWMQQILEGLRHMHHKMNPPVIHRDLKPENVFIADGENPDEYYNIKIGDFGLATAKTQTRKTMLGTLGYMAPEMLQERYDEKVDIFAFGLLMVELVTNCVPYQECQNFMDVWQRIASTTPPQVLDRLENPEIRDIFFTCTHPLPDFRPTSEELLSLQIFNLKPIPVQVQLVRLSQTVRWQDDEAAASPTQPTVTSSASSTQLSSEASAGASASAAPTASKRPLSSVAVEYVGDPGRYYHVADFRLVVNDRALQQQMRILPGVGFEFQLDCFIDEDLENVVNSFADLAESDAPGLSADQLRRLRQKVVASVRNQLLYYRKKVLAGIWNYFMDLIRDSEPEQNSELDTCIVRLGLQARRWAEAKRRVIKERDDYNGRWEEESGVGAVNGNSGGVSGVASSATSSATVSRQVSSLSDSQQQQQQQHMVDCLCQNPMNESPTSVGRNFDYGLPASPSYRQQMEANNFGIPAAMSASMPAIPNGHHHHHGNGLQFDFLSSNSFASPGPSASATTTVTASAISSMTPISIDMPVSPLLQSLDVADGAMSAPVSPLIRLRNESGPAADRQQQQLQRRSESPAPPTTPTAPHHHRQPWSATPPTAGATAQLLLPGMPPQPLPGLEAGRCLLLCPGPRASASATAGGAAVTCLAFDGGPQMRLEDVLAILTAVQSAAAGAAASPGNEERTADATNAAAFGAATAIAARRSSGSATHVGRFTVLPLAESAGSDVALATGDCCDASVFNAS